MKTSKEMFNPIAKTLDEINLENDIIETIKNDDTFVQEVIKPLKLSKSEFRNHLFLFNQSRIEFNNCQNCLGLKKCNNECKGFKMIPSKEFGIIKKKFYPCLDYLEFKTRLDKFVYKDFEDEKNNLFLKDIKTLRDGRRQSLKIVLKEILNNNLQNWIYIYGDSKSSKTDFLIAFCNEFSKLNRGNIAFIDMMSIVEIVKDVFYKNKEQYEVIMENLINVDLLALDGFNNNIFMNTIIRDQFITPILKSRSDNKKITIISSNCDLDELCYFLSMNQFGIKSAEQIISIIDKNKYKKIYKLEHLRVC